MNIRLLTKEEYIEHSAKSHCQAKTHVSYTQVKHALSELPDFNELFFISGQVDDFPDDHDKVDVCFGVMDIDTGKVAIFWNYKSGPNYNGSDYTLDDIKEFSVYGDMTFSKTFTKWVLLENVKSGE